MGVALEMTAPFADRARLWLSLVLATAIVCSVVSTKTLHVNMDAISEFPFPLCAADASSGNKVEIVTRYRTCPARE
jgi:hypothetical protein